MGHNIRVVEMLGEETTFIVILVSWRIIEASASSSAPRWNPWRVAGELRRAMPHVGVTGRGRGKVETSIMSPKITITIEVVFSLTHGRPAVVVGGVSAPLAAAAGTPTGPTLASGKNKARGGKGKTGSQGNAKK